MEDHKVVDEFVKYLRNNGYKGIKIDARPENDKNTPANMRIDAIAGQFAIEHTSIDTLPNQRGRSGWFMQVVGGLEEELPRLPYRLNITLEYEAITIGQNWEDIRNALRSWITQNSADLKDGRHILDNVPGVPFRLRVTKQSDRPPRIIFGRIAPEDESLPERIRQHLDSKIKKLAPYQERGFITVLLIESEDVALMNESKMLDALRKAYPEGLPTIINKIWFVDTSISTEILFRDFSDLVIRAK